MIVITGGAGFIGSALLWQLNRDDRSDIMVVDRMGDGLKWRNLNKRTFDEIMHKDRFLGWLESTGAKASIDVIFHLGASSSTAMTDVDYLVDNNLNYTKALWHYCVSRKIPFIYASSGATYGAGEKGFSDDIWDGLQPTNPYGFSKEKFDSWAMRQPKAPPFWAGLKFFNVYGPNEYHKVDQFSPVAHFVPQVKQTGVIRLFQSHRQDVADGDQQRDFVYVKDCVKVINHFHSNRESITSGIYNLGTGQARTFRDVAHQIFKTMGRPSDIQYIPTPEHLREHYQYFTQADLTRLREVGGYRDPMTSLEDGIEDYLTNYLLTDDPYL